ncbi:conserved hypothetical protein [Culex quinquefasciatus]|uniref:Uncharacterized protein n=1 Tax=Culex quinquefasciatus TaxID=7176 RepID=B0WJ12_CULQU|nr:conserved hypothetical protein [Culex quinquefasciatus]|eukprot:XP_001848696.1 conserved hypothetical protein [Culex quinquefasciatus]
MRSRRWATSWRAVTVSPCPTSWTTWSGSRCRCTNSC